jgi:hypothetical protein
LPAQVSVRVDTPDLTLTGEPVVAATPAPPASSAPAGDNSRIWVAVVLGLAVAALVVAVVVVTVRRRRRSRAPVGDPPDEPVAEPPSSPVVARGHASVPGGRHDDPGPPKTIARGRAVVPDPKTQALPHPPE